MSNPHNERRRRWLEETEILEFSDSIWVEESNVFSLLDRELALERRRNAMLLCKLCEDDKPFRDRDSNTFVHHTFVNESPTVRLLKTVPCYADVLWRNEDQ